MLPASPLLVETKLATFIFSYLFILLSSALLEGDHGALDDYEVYTTYSFALKSLLFQMGGQREKDTSKQIYQ